LKRLDEKQKEDREAVHNTLGIFENICELLPHAKDILREKTDLLDFLIQRIFKVKIFDPNKLYASELLAILLQSSPETQRKVVTMGAFESLLTSIAFYKKTNPASTEEEEMLENLFDCVCSCLLLDEHKSAFLKAEGLQLMLLVIKGKKFGRKGALKVLDFALTRNKLGCKQFIDLLGLKTLFAAFMKKGAAKNKKGFSEREDDEHIVSIISSLFSHMDTKSSRYSRLVSKFAENNYEKVERLIELLGKYTRLVAGAEKEITSVEGEDEDGLYLKRLDSGLFTLQLTNLVIAHIAVNEVKERLFQLLDQHNHTKEKIVAVLQEYRENLGDAMGEKQREKEKQELEELIKKFQAA